MTRLMEYGQAELIKEIRKQTTELEFGLMYNEADKLDLDSVELFMKNALAQLDAAKLLIKQI